LTNAQQTISAPLPAPGAEIGVIGGTGFYQMCELTEVQRIRLETPLGAPSSAITIGTLHCRRVAFISRHDEGHLILLSELPAQANIWALKSIGVRQLLTVSAVGSLREEMAPLYAVIPDQLIDRPQGRPATFFGDGIVAHVAFADPFDPTLSDVLATAASEVGVTTQRGGTLVVIDGPDFSTRAESKLYRSWDASIIGMTALPEAKLAREAELCYGSLCFATDYDTWHETEDDVSSEPILQHLRQNADNARQTISRAVASLGTPPNDCECHSALAGAVITRRDLVPIETRRKLQLLLEPHWGQLDSEGDA
jgi:5'-methylthioadenosine phosphorylase